MRAKRALDAALGVVLLIVLLPVLLLLAVLIWLTSGRPVLFLQTRPGLAAEPFTLVKFRTMKDSFDADGEFQADELRITRLGAFLRSASLDELPELWNVVKGDMSLVGPRPLLVEYLDLYTPEQARRHDIKPGITGLAQVSGRNAQSWEERLALDVWYVDNRSMWLDLRILSKTVTRVLTRHGISADGHATMPEFEGGGDV